MPLNEIKAQQTNRLAALLPEIMNAIGGGDQKTEQILQQQKQQSEQIIQQNNLRNFMRVVTSPQTGKITPESITHYAQIFDIRPDVAMKVIGDFAQFRKNLAPQDPKPSQYSRLLPTGQVNSIKTTTPPTGEGWLPGTITGSPRPMPETTSPQKQLAQTWYKKDPATGRILTVKAYKQPSPEWNLGKPEYQQQVNKQKGVADEIQAQKKSLNKQIGQLRKEIYRVKSGKKQIGLLTTMIMADAQKNGIDIPGFNGNGSGEGQTKQGYLNYLEKKLADTEDALRGIQTKQVQKTDADNPNNPKKLTFSLENGWSE